MADAEVTRILDGLDAGTRDSGGPKRPLSYRQPALHVWFEDVGQTCFSAPSRWISRSGIALLWGRFLHQKVSCVVQLITIHGTWNDVRAEVCGCRYLAPHVYEIELTFAHPVDLSLYCKTASGVRVLLVDDQQLLAKLAMHQLKELHATAEYCAEPSAVFDLLMSDRFDVVLIDINMPRQNGDELLRELRQKGYTGRAVAFTASADDAAVCQRLLALGFDDVLGKPFTRAQLERALEACRAEPITSGLADDPTMGALIGGFVTQLHVWVRELQEAAAASDLPRVGELAREIRAQGGVFGFEIISAAGGAIERAVADPCGLEAVERAIRRLGELARLVRAPLDTGQ
jgi:CheY-like chemotaxis protein